MKKLSLAIFALALSAFGVVTTANPVFADSRSSTPTDPNRCIVTTVGEKNSVNQPDSKFTRSNGVTSLRYTVTGKDNCTATVAIRTFYTLNNTGFPREAQQLYKETLREVKKGDRGTISVELPQGGTCFFQADFFHVNSHPNKFRKDEVLGWYLGGTKGCINPIKVCDLTTKKIVTITENKFDPTRHTKDLTKCAAAPVPPANTTPTPPAASTPQVLASTGPEQAIMGLIGSGSVVGSAVYYFRSRRDLIASILQR